MNVLIETPTRDTERVSGTEDKYAHFVSAMLIGW